MTFTTLAIKSTFRNRLRVGLTATGVAIAIVAFLFLRTIIGAYYAGFEAAATDRLVTRNKISITFPLPIAHAGKIKTIPGVEDVTWANWFGGVYIEPKNFFAQFGVEPESYLKLYPEILLTEEEKKAWVADRSGAIVGEALAKQYKWKIGDQIPLKGDIYPGDWSFTIRGIYRGRDRATDVQSMYFHWKLLDERVSPERKNQVGIFLFKVSDPSKSAQVSHAVDALFANSINETRTESEKAFQLAFLSMAGAIMTAIQIVSAVMLAILMLILGNTMAMSSRERTGEYAVMRSIGFLPGHIIGLVLAEGAVVALAGFGLAVVLAPPLLRGFADVGQSSFGNFLGNFELSTQSVAMAGSAALVGGILATVMPALRAGRLRIVDALRRVE